ncbi:hypothetical protein [Rhodopirellula bahusiensis]|nr:hypothetical protein [Rhodopirellula bahusiensis]
MMKRQHKIWSSSEGRIDLNESFKVGVQATVDTFILVRQSREGDLDWSKARMAAKDFLFAIGELRKFTIQCRSLADGITEKEASRRIEVQRDIRLAKVDPSGVQYGQESKEVDDSTQNLLEEWPTRRKDNWPRPLAEKVRELRLSGETWQDVKRHLRQIDLEQLPRKYQNNPIPKTWPSRQIQDRWIGMLNSIEQFERLQSNKAEHEMSKEVFGEKTE